ncbi:MAG: thioredoxin domain-containing protein [Candidatus ainarchaeum sp.]|nr:thioredoxin domain-containing protein [Candidatus ainarchaeum sp.]
MAFATKTLPAEKRLEAIIKDRPFVGAADAPVTIIGFTDYRCPPCTRAARTIDAMLEEFQGKVKYVSLSFQLAYRNSELAARAFEIALELDPEKAFGMKKLMLKAAVWRNGDLLDSAHLEQYAAEAGLDAKKFGEALDRGAKREEVEAQRQLAMDLGLESAPVFFIGQRVIVGAQDDGKFRAAIREALAEARRN